MWAGTHTGLNGAWRGSPLAGESAWTAIVLAGSRPGADPLASRLGLPFKALVPVVAEPMISRVVRTLLGCERIGRVLIISQEPKLLADKALGGLAQDPRIALAAGRPDIAGSIAAVIGTDEAPWPVLVTTADHPLLTAEMVDHFLDASAGADASFGVVERSVVLARFPETRRTWIRFGRGAYTGANLFTLRTDRSSAAVDLFARAEADRKRKLRLLWHFGPALAIGAAARAISLAGVTLRLGRRLGIRIEAVSLPFPEAGIDVDRAEDLALAERVLGARAEQGGKRPGTGVSVFDLDRTLTRRGTFTAFLLYAARRRAAWRLLLTPVAMVHFLRCASRRIDRKRLKERLQQMFIGERAARGEVEALAADYARRLRRRGFNRQGLAQMEEERRQGRRIVLATAANAFYANAIGHELGVDEVVCTQSAWEGDALLARIEGENCYGEDKLAMLRARLERPELPRAAIHVRFFSDHRSDACSLRWADQAFVVNPRRRLRAYAEQQGWPVLNWR